MGYLLMAALPLVPNDLFCLKYWKMMSRSRVDLAKY